jgi:hypothetical protein
VVTGTAKWVAHPGVHVNASRTHVNRPSLLCAIGAIALGLIAVGSPAATAAPLSTTAISPAATADAGLFGSQNPTYDGVFRQSTAILGLTAVGQRVPASAVAWLLRQQCRDGSFMSYRADTTVPCPPVNFDTYTGPDTNSTSLAAMALTAVSAGQRDPSARAATRARAWLRSQQTPGGGYSWLEGLKPDATSTSMVLTALGRTTASDRQAARWLDRQVKADARCGVSFQPGGDVDPLSTTWAYVSTLPTVPPQPITGPRQPGRACTGAVSTARDTRAWIAKALIAGQGQIPSSFEPGATDWNSTALGTLGMTQRTGTTRAMRLGIAALQANVTAYVGAPGSESPTALGTLLMVAHAGKVAPRDFGGVNLISKLRGTLTR